MATLRELTAYETVANANRKKLNGLPDPMELARLASALKPELAAGSRTEQREAVVLARRLFDIAVDVSTRLTDAQKLGLTPSEVALTTQKAIATEFSEGCVPYDPDGRGEDALQVYLHKHRIKVPKSYKRGDWKRLLAEHGFEKAGQHFVPKKVVDDEVHRIKRKDADRQVVKRKGVADAKIPRSK